MGGGGGIIATAEGMNLVGGGGSVSSPESKENKSTHRLDLSGSTVPGAAAPLPLL